MKNKKSLPIFIFVILIVFLINFWAWKHRQILNKLLIATDKTEYQQGEVLKVTIKNNLIKNICFSSCYPYLLEKKNAKWEFYSYVNCPKKDLNKDCIQPTQTKVFMLTLSLVEKGLHRMALPVCLGCQEDTDFIGSQRFYSNEFTIK